MPKKTTKNNFDPKIIAVIFIGISTVIAFILGGFFLGQNPNPDLEDIKNNSVYKNSEYDFEITYPAEGKIISEQGKISYGKCGQAIRPEPMSSYNYVLAFDNYFMLTQQTFSGTIQEFIDSYPESNLFNTKTINVPGADEVVSISKKADTNPEDLMKSPFAYALRIIKKGNNMFTILGLQNDGNTNGCVPANDQERNKVIDSFRFIN